jgi:hypothetical protein
MDAQVRDETAISAVVERLNAASQIVNSLVLTHRGDEDHATVMDLQAAIEGALSFATAADGYQRELVRAIAWLKERLAAFKAWEDERATYEIKRFDPGVFIYRRKRAGLTRDQRLSDEVEYLLCPNCFDNRRKSILQSTPRIERRYQVHMCPDCQNEYAFHYEPNGTSV